MTRINRRGFLESAACTGFAMTKTIKEGAGNNKKLNIGLISCGWHGMVDVKAALTTDIVKIIGICDVDTEHLADSDEKIEKLQGSHSTTFKHYNDLLDIPELQPVIIATPPHWHALPFLKAVKTQKQPNCVPEADNKLPRNRRITQTRIPIPMDSSL